MGDRINRWGIEIEAFNLSRRRVKELVEDTLPSQVCLVQEIDETALSPLNWTVISDGSIRGDRPFELRSPANQGEEDAWDDITFVCKALVKAGAKVNASCGFHVHHDVTSAFKAARYIPELRFEERKLSIPFRDYGVHAYARLEAALDSCVPPSRRGSNNQYCTTLLAVKEPGEMTFEEVISRRTRSVNLDNGYGHYGKLSVDAYRRHGTFEFRQHSGTLNPAKIQAWVKLTGLITNQITRLFLEQAPLPRAFKQLEEALEWLGASPTLAEYFINRRDALAAVSDKKQTDTTIIDGYKFCTCVTCWGIYSKSYRYLADYTTIDMVEERPLMLEAVLLLRLHAYQLRNFENTGDSRILVRHLREFLGRKAAHLKVGTSTASLEILEGNPFQNELATADSCQEPAEDDVPGKEADYRDGGDPQWLTDMRKNALATTKEELTPTTSATANWAVHPIFHLPVEQEGERPRREILTGNQRRALEALINPLPNGVASRFARFSESLNNRLQLRPRSLQEVYDQIQDQAHRGSPDFVPEAHVPREIAELLATWEAEDVEGGAAFVTAEMEDLDNLFVSYPGMHWLELPIISPRTLPDNVSLAPYVANPYCLFREAYGSEQLYHYVGHLVAAYNAIRNEAYTLLRERQDALRMELAALETFPTRALGSTWSVRAVLRTDLLRAGAYAQDQGWL